MKIATFELERYFAKYEFSTKYLLSSSDCESLSMSELIEMASQETLKAWQELKLGYTEIYGHPLLRESIAEIYSSLKAENILTVVPSEGIFLLMNTLLKPGDHIVCTFPGYQSLYEIAQSIGCDISFWQPQEEQGWKFCINDLRKKLQTNTKLVVANFPHNPTGYVPPLQDFHDLIDIVYQQGAYLFSDEMYRFLETEETSTLPSASEIYDKAFSLFGLSKTFGLPGLRLGWMASQNNAILEKMSQLKDYTTICGSAPSEILAVMAIKNRQQIIESQRQRIQRNLKHLNEFCQKHQDFITWNKPIGGSICFPRLSIAETTLQFCEKLVTDTGIMLLPSEVFNFGNKHVRIGFGRENFPQVLQILSDYLEKQK
ncbi:aminotransferase class I/II-fold pyridoxal phosphate-dependent enzyme [Candidatus Uabimicrobium sp. HlEnr_7]|uniref:aminotransferase class I/II-fold pyridoxal phosphate-dependent enzyme n=1 Tax=Candidatus Uabimicrobium helgolandensis TaxID=3095367 RepID=UPI0035587875